MISFQRRSSCSYGTEGAESSEATQTTEHSRLSILSATFIAIVRARSLLLPKEHRIQGKGRLLLGALIVTEGRYKGPEYRLGYPH